MEVNFVLDVQVRTPVADLRCTVECLDLKHGIIEVVMN